MFFTNTGRVYVEKVYEIPEMGRTARGKSIANILALQPNEKVAALICVQEFSDKQHLVMATASGIVKRRIWPITPTSEKEESSGSRSRPGTS